MILTKQQFAQQMALNILGNANLNDIATKGRYTVAEVLKCVADIEKHHPTFFGGGGVAQIDTDKLIPGDPYEST